MSITPVKPHPLNYSRGLVWLRRDLRLSDHAALYHALRSCKQVLLCFVFDTEILNALPRVDSRVEFILASLHDVNTQLRAWAEAAQLPQPERVQLIVRHGAAQARLPTLAIQLGVQAVFCNQDYEPAAIARDQQVRGALANAGIMLHSFKDQVIFEHHEVLSAERKPYGVFASYQRRWLQKLSPFYLQAYPCERYAAQLAALPPTELQPLPSLSDLDFSPSNLAQLKIPTGSSGAVQMLAHFLPRIEHYAHDRDYPAQRGVSYLSVHLRFGTISIRQLARQAHLLAEQGNQGAAAWLKELIWRDFYMQILAHHPLLAKGKSFKPAFDAIKWEKGARAQALFAAWCQGRTGYPLVDAAMLQLNYSGYMHNRLRMVTASFLCKQLGVDWRWGEAYFAEKLNDFDLASNNGGWQWAAGTGCDAQPYFRIFNPILQSEKFDPDGHFIKRYLPQLAELNAPNIHAPWLCDAIELQAAGLKLGSSADCHYPLPIVELGAAREKTKARYAAALANPPSTAGQKNKAQKKAQQKTQR